MKDIGGGNRMFPEEISRALLALSSSARQEILSALLEKEGLSYTELLKMLGMRKGSLTHHLRALTRAGLVRNYSEGGLLGPYASFYARTDFGKQLITSISSSLQPEVERISTPANAGGSVFSIGLTGTGKNALLARIEANIQSMAATFGSPILILDEADSWSSSSPSPTRARHTRLPVMVTATTR